MVMIINKLACEKEQASNSIWVPYYTHIIIIISLPSWYPLSSWNIILFKREASSFIETCWISKCSRHVHVWLSEDTHQPYWKWNGFVISHFWESLNQGVLRKFDFSWGKISEASSKDAWENWLNSEGTTLRILTIVSLLSLCIIPYLSWSSLSNEIRSITWLKDAAHHLRQYHISDPSISKVFHLFQFDISNRPFLKDATNQK